jgi:hypothetical protein
MEIGWWAESGPRPLRPWTGSPLHRTDHKAQVGRFSWPRPRRGDTRGTRAVTVRRAPVVSRPLAARWRQTFDVVFSYSTHIEW